MAENSQPKDCKFIMDCYGNFKISVDGVLSKPAQYEDVAAVFKDNKTYIAVSQYYDGTLLPTETVMQVIPIKTILADAEVCNFYHPEEPCTHTEFKNIVSKEENKNASSN
jgi:hypothetical protein